MPDDTKYVVFQDDNGKLQFEEFYKAILSAPNPGGRLNVKRGGSSISNTLEDAMKGSKKHKLLITFEYGGASGAGVSLADLFEELRNIGNVTFGADITCVN